RCIGCAHLLSEASASNRMTARQPSIDKVSAMTVSTFNPRMNKLAAGLAVAISLIGVQTHVSAKSNPVSQAIAVTNCADDGSYGTLRQAIARANSGDQIDLSGLSCAG